MKFIIEGIPNLKGLMISETGCTTLTLGLIHRKLKNIEKLWFEHN